MDNSNISSIDFAIRTKQKIEVKTPASNALYESYILVSTGGIDVGDNLMLVVICKCLWLDFDVIDQNCHQHLTII